MDEIEKRIEQVLKMEAQRYALAGLIAGLIKLDPSKDFYPVQQGLIDALIQVLEETPVDDFVDEAFNNAIEEKTGIMGEVFSIINDN
jgi:hypothetical protein